MASLSQILQPVPTPEMQAPEQYSWLGGQLVKSSEKGIQQLANQAGTPTPTSGIQAALLGATPQQQAMSGTPANVQSVLKQQATPKQMAPTVAINQQNTYANQKATQAPSTQQTQEQQVQTQQAQQLQGLTGIQGQVQNLINSKINQLASTQVAPPTAVSIEPANVQQALATLISNPSDPTALATVNTLLGNTPTTPLTTDQINALYNPASATVVAGATQALPTSVSVGDLVKNPDFGYSLDQLSQVLGIPADKVASMSLPDLQGAINSLSTAQNQNAQTQAASLQQGGASQQAFQNQSKQLEASGVASTENQLNQIQQAVKSGQTIQFNGQSVALNDLLGNTGITKTISDYLNSAPGSEIRTTLDSKEPALSQFINSNLTALQALQSKLDTSVTNFNKQQATNIAAATVGNTQLSDSVMKAVDPNWGTFQSNAASSQLVSNLAALPQAQAEAAAGALNTIAQNNPELLSSVATLTPQELAAIANPDIFQNLSLFNTQQGQIKSALSSNDTDQALSLVVGQTVTTKQIQDQLVQDQQRAALGLPTSGLDKKVSLNDLGSAQAILSNAGLLNAQAPSMQQVTSGTEQVTRGSLPVESALTPAQTDALQTLSPYITSSGLKINATQLLQSGITSDDLQALQQSGFLSTLKGMTGGETGAVQQIQTQALDKATAPLLAQYSVPSIPANLSPSDATNQLSQVNASITALQAVVGLPGAAATYDIPAIQNQIQQLQTMSTALQKLASAGTTPVSTPPAPAPTGSGNPSFATKVSQAAGNVLAPIANPVKTLGSVLSSPKRWF